MPNYHLTRLLLVALSILRGAVIAQAAETKPLTLNPPAAAPRPTYPIQVRAAAGFGIAHSFGENSMSGLSYHVGGRFLLPAGKAGLRYGLEASFVAPFAENSDQRYVAFGIILEATLWKHFLAAIGTVGYIAAAGPQSSHPFGLVTNLGWSPEWNFFIRPFVTYRAEFIFADAVIIDSSLSAGIGFSFDAIKRR